MARLMRLGRNPPSNADLMPLGNLQLLEAFCPVGMKGQLIGRTSESHRSREERPEDQEVDAKTRWNLNSELDMTWTMYNFSIGKARSEILSGFCRYWLVMEPVCRDVEIRRDIATPQYRNC